MKRTLNEELTRLLGPEIVRDDPATLAAHSADKWFASHAPEAVVFPRNTAQVSRLLAFANGRGIPVTPRGAGVGYVGGCVPGRGGVVLSLARMSRIKEISAGDGVAVVEPGVITGDLQAAARREGLYYPPDPASLKECTLGGNIATNAGGPCCLKYGVTRPWVLGLEVVLASGEILRTGGRTHKNKTGFDLVGLFTGSEGLLGVVTEATLRLIPLPPARATLSASFATFPQATEAVQRVLAGGFLPSALEIADAFTLAAARRHLGAEIRTVIGNTESIVTVPTGGGHLLIELDGQPDSVRGELAAIAQLLTSFGVLHLQTATGLNARDDANSDPGAAQCEALWELRRQFSASLRALAAAGTAESGAENPASTPLTKLNEDIVVPRSRLVELVEFAAALGAKHGCPVATFGHAGDGNLHVNLMAPHYDQPAVKARMTGALDELFAQVLAWGGAITGEHGIGLAKERWWAQAASPVSRGVHAALKTALDPKGILNPGKFVQPRPAP